MIATISWQSAQHELERLIPGCSKFLPDPIAEAAQKIGYEVPFIPMNDWELLADDVMFSRILPDDMNLSESAIVVTDSSFSDARPFQLQLKELDDFVKWHFAQFNEPVFSGDVIIVFVRLRTIVLFHHSGFHSTIVFK